LNDGGVVTLAILAFYGFLCYREAMLKKKSKVTGHQLPLIVEKDEDGVYVVECPVFEGCYSQGKTLDEALRNIREVISMIVGERTNKEILRSYHPQELSLHTITV